VVPKSTSAWQMYSCLLSFQTAFEQQTEKNVIAPMERIRIRAEYINKDVPLIIACLNELCLDRAARFDLSRGVKRLTSTFVQPPPSTRAKPLPLFSTHPRDPYSVI
jgi:hypothetical protein